MSKVQTTITIHMNNSCCDTIEKQLNQQGLTLGVKADVYEEIRRCVCFLEQEEVLCEKDIDKIGNRLGTKLIGDTRWIVR